MLQWMKRILKRTPSPPVVAEATAPQPAAYSSDQPISRRAEDRFNRAPFASRIATTIATRKDPASLVVGLYGPWGDGKTSVLEMMREELARHPHVVLVTFNPWHFPSQETLVRGFFTTLSTALGKSLPTFKERIGSVLSQYGSLLSPWGVGDAAQGVGTALAAVDLAELKKRLEAILHESGKRVVVLLDDIDRLDRAETHAIFKLVKLSAGFRYTAYVLAFDDEVVAAALGERYGANDAKAGRAFLEKIIQVPLHLPPAEEISLRSLAFQGVDEALQLAGIALSPEDESRFINLFLLGLQPRLTTPRLAKLYANSLIFALPILKGEVDPVDQMLLEGVRIFHPALYKAITEHSELFLSSRREGRRHNEPDLLDAVLSGIFSPLAELEREMLQEFLERLFPRTGTSLYLREWDAVWEKKKRLCSARYFWRYLLYGMPGGDVPDGEVDQILASLIHTDPELTSAAFAGLAERRQLPTIVRKLRALTPALDDVAAERLAVSFARQAHRLPREKDLFSIGGTFEQSAILVSQLVRQLPPGERREQLSRHVLEIADPLGFGLACLRWLVHDPSGTDSDRLLPIEVEPALEIALAERARDRALREPLYLSDPEDASALHQLWGMRLDSEALSAELVHRFAEHPDEVDPFIAGYVGRAWAMDTWQPQRGNLNQGDYARIAGIVPPEVIAEILRTRYHPVDPQYDQEEGVPTGLALAHQFLHIHHRATKQVATEAEPEADE